MKKLFSLGTLGLAGIVGAGLISMPGTVLASGGDDEVAAKREDNVAELVLVSDDDNDDTADRTRTRTRSRSGTRTRTRSRNTGVSRSTRDHTRSNFTRVSRNRDLSRSDKTRDWTSDGGARKRDWTADHTNDRTRNDTRGR